MNEIKILGLYVSSKIKDKAKLQNVLTKYGNVIRTRIGLNQENAAPGIILLELFGDQEQINYFERALTGIEGLEIQSMNFSGK
ncbi:MAG: hypothetical protein EOM06_04105 [Sphingobacteriia bacterium]|nr:hypothetical protein [Sphingobacteriia bacterium]HPE33980.1 hypothetical protein [Bacteroidales bacterium]HPR56975.1 hypothetical protein [Bacteroidales bacterium]HRW97536.1 hypothetical protein [Bacteroidales bacterium]